MASTVTVIGAGAQRQVVKVSPGKYLHEIRAEACARFRLDPDKYGLKHNHKNLDLSSLLRQTGLPSGARLELVQLSKSAGVVTVALQLPEVEAKDVPGGRLVDKFPSTTTLWLILRKFEAGVAGSTKPRNLTARASPKMTGGESGSGRLYYERPVLNIMGRELASFVELQKTLSTLGLNAGTILLKLRFEVSDTPFEEAQEQIGRYFAEVEEPSTNGAVNTKEEQAVPVASEPTIAQMATDSPPMPEAEPEPDVSTPIAEPPPTLPFVADVAEAGPSTIPGLSDRPVQVFAPPSGTKPRAAQSGHNPDDYEFTVDHAKIQKAEYGRHARNKPLPSDAEIEAAATAAVAQRASVQSVTIKIRFPDQSSVVADFAKADTGQDLYGLVRNLMRHGEAPFVLRWQSPKGMIDVPHGTEKLIGKVGLTGRVQVTLTWKEGTGPEERSAPALKSQVNDLAKEIEVKEIESPPGSGNATGTGDVDEAPAKEKKKGAIPAWLKKSLPGKK